ncbi:MAG: PEP-CTERM sorting domain-containing protein [Nitrosomonas sp.]|nr:PEP-CTERM sorting domain-containing protein [Nitrosomonas sp.]
MIYLGHGSDALGSFIYTLDDHGNFINELDFGAAYSSSNVINSLNYDRSSKHLWVSTTVIVGSDYTDHFVEIDPSTAKIYNDLQIDHLDSAYVRNDGIWTTLFEEDVIRHYDLNGVFIGDISVADIFPGFPGPSGLASAPDGGFYIIDHFGQRIVEIDIAGHEIGVASTAFLGGRAFAIDSDIDTHRIFLQVGNDEIYVLSTEFITAVPEADTWVMLLVGLGFVGMAVKRQRKRVWIRYA